MRSRRIFISCVSDEFATLRESLRFCLKRADCDVKVQEELSQSPGNTLGKLHAYIRSCDAVLHLLGATPGATVPRECFSDFLGDTPEFLANKPTLRKALGDYSGLSYTQWEAYLAQHCGVSLFVYALKSADYEESQKNHRNRLELVDRHASLFRDSLDLVGQLIGDLQHILPGIKREGLAGARPFPRLLPYLTDRAVQAQELESALDTIDAGASCRPHVFFVHGSDQECHDKFLDRVRETILPDCTPGKSMPVEMTRMEWPFAHPDLVTRAAEMRKLIAKNVTRSRHASPKDVKAELDRCLAVQMLYFMVSAATWGANEQTLLEHWLGYWNEFPDLAPGRRLVVFLTLRYGSGDGLDTLRGNQAAAAFLRGLDYGKYPGIVGRVLTELKSIEPIEVEQWIQAHTPRDCDEAELLRHVSAYFEGRKGQPVPMLVMAKKLEEFLHLARIN